ncbi:MAG TPA: inositol monophosphatase family protein [Actinomycetota bacterium]|nr:inositol monophosphatase family protein [Actinomycetota bacterium]
MAQPAPDILDRLAWAEQTALSVGELLLGSFRTGVAAERKERGVVTELDRRAEALIAGSLGEAFPGDGLLAEEGTGREATSPYRWVVDPLDGTTNYVAGLPMFAVSLGCLDAAGAVLGVVHAPALGDTFTTVRGGGFDRPEASAGADLGAAVFIVNKAYHPAPLLWSVAGGLMASVRAFRTFGCVSLDLALVAAGRADGLVLLPADPWDVAAGMLLVREAGLSAGDLAGGAEPDGRRGILATSGALFANAAGLLHVPPLAG